MRSKAYNYNMIEVNMKKSIAFKFITLIFITILSGCDDPYIANCINQSEGQRELFEKCLSDAQNGDAAANTKAEEEKEQVDEAAKTKADEENKLAEAIVKFESASQKICTINYRKRNPVSVSCEDMMAVRATLSEAAKLLDEAPDAYAATTCRMVNDKAQSMSNAPKSSRMKTRMAKKWIAMCNEEVETFGI